MIPPTVFFNAVEKEMRRARSFHQPIASIHEGYEKTASIRESVEEASVEMPSDGQYAAVENMLAGLQKWFKED